MNDEEHVERIREWNKGQSGDVKANVEELLDFIDNSSLPVGNESRESVIDILFFVINSIKNLGEHGNKFGIRKQTLKGIIKLCKMALS